MKKILRVLVLAGSLASAIMFSGCSDAIDEQEDSKNEQETASVNENHDFARYCFTGSYGVSGSGRSGSNSGFGGK
ncbi:MAG: hypothetical protein IJ727_05175 [Treponema sp.]|nr:hypothetical protein [Treponema sp.]